MAPFGPGQSSRIGGWRGRDHLFFKQTGQRCARCLGRLQQLHDLRIRLLVIFWQHVAVADSLEVDGVVRGDDGQGALDTRVQRPSESLADVAAQRNQAAPKGAS